MLGFIVTITPIVGWSWPALVPIASAVAGYIGFVKLTGRDSKSRLMGRITQQMKNRKVVSVPLYQYIKDVVAEEMDREERLEFKKDNIILIFRKDARGHFYVEVEGPISSTRRELIKIADAFAKNIIQQFAYNKVVKELTLRGVNVVEEEINEKGEIIIQTRKWD